MLGVRDAESLKRSAFEHLWMHSRDWIEMGEEGGPPIMVGGEGIRVVDAEGKTWIDANGGYSSVNVGYGRTEIAEAVRDQMLRLTYFPQGSTTEPMVRLAEKLAQITPGSLERTWPVTGGSEANETAVKIARAYHRRMGEPGRYKVISRKGSYHGATGGVLWMGGDGRTERSDYEPAYPGMLHAPHPDPYRCELGGETPSECAVRCAQAVEDLIVQHGAKTVAAVIAEPVAAGCRVPGDEYWPMLRDICDRYGVVLIADEVVCGFGRTGTWFGVEQWDIVPDIMSVAKGITSSYLPLAGAVARREIADAFAGDDNTFRQALTFGGHPVAAAAALKNIEIIEREGLVSNSTTMGAYFKRELEGLKVEHRIIGDVRGLGLMLAVELVSDRETKAGFPADLNLADRLKEKFRRRGILLGAGQTISISPPLCIGREDVDVIVEAIDGALGELEGELGDMM